MTEFVKRSPDAPPGFFACEAAGLRWLSAAEGGVPCAPVLGCDPTGLTLQRLSVTAPTSEAAREFGRRLAVTHDSGAAGFGAAPDGWQGPGFFGPLHHPLPMTLRAHSRWGSFYADERLLPMLEPAADRLGPDGWAVLERVADRCRDGHFDDDDVPARLHGDLWSGNVMSDEHGAPVLIDPAVYGGHREMDLAMLALFGSPSARFFGAYDAVYPRSPGHEARVALHQLLPLLVHVGLFGGGYVRAVEEAADRALGR